MASSSSSGSAAVASSSASPSSSSPSSSSPSAALAAAQRFALEQGYATDGGDSDADVVMELSDDELPAAPNTAPPRPLRPAPKATPPKKAGNGRESIRVICRIRPQNQKERAAGAVRCVEAGEPGEEDAARVTVRTRDKAYAYDFDCVLGESSTQDEVHEAVAGAGLANAIVQGYNAAVLAYGQTGSGKTYTMMGIGEGAFRQQQRQLATSPLRGLIPRLLDGLFERLRLHTSELVVSTVRVSYIEVYNENIRDLLSRDSQRSIRLRESPNGLWITDATERPVMTPGAALDALAEGNVNRATHATKFNLESSRSHALFVLSVQVQDGIKHTTSNAQLYLVDLAGSEKVSKTGVTGDRLTEARHINASLLALGKVIATLAERKPGKHVPFRDSKLTRLLQNSLGGSSRTVLVINASPSSDNVVETLSTMRFGERARRISNKPTANTSRSARELELLLKASQRRVRDLEGTVVELREQLAMIRAGVMPSAVAPPLGPIPAESAPAPEPEPEPTPTPPPPGPAVVWDPVPELTRSTTVRETLESRRFRELCLQMLCPLSRKLMRDPVVAADGVTYDRAAIEAWFRDRENREGFKTKSPASGMLLTSTRLIPNRSLQVMIDVYFKDGLGGGRDGTVNAFYLFPVEVICMIARHLAPRDLVMLTSTCRFLNDALRGDRLLWRDHLASRFEIRAPTALAETEDKAAFNQDPMALFLRLNHREMMRRAKAKGKGKAKVVEPGGMMLFRARK